MEHDEVAAPGTPRILRHRVGVGWAWLALAISAACATGRPAVVGPLAEPAATATSLERSTGLSEPARIDFSWRLNEAGSRVSGVGVARVEPPYRARLDLFLDNHESVISAALVDDDLRLPPGAPDDILPPVELMWATLGVFRPVSPATLAGGDRLEGDAERLRYDYTGNYELHYEVGGGSIRALELLERGSVVQWVRVSQETVGAWPDGVTYRNLVDFRELEISRDSVRVTEGFDPAIFDPR